VSLKDIFNFKILNMKTFAILLSLLAIQIGSFGQTPQTVTIDNNKLSLETIKPELQYLFPDFQKGSVILRDHPEIKCKLNYNFLLDDIIFIDENGKKMALANQQDLLKVYINDRTFIPSSKGYYEVIELGVVSLVYKWTCSISDQGRQGALGITTDAPSVVQMNRISFDAREWKLDVSKEVVVAVEVLPFLKIKSKFIPVKVAKDFIKAYPGKSSEIKKYISQNPVDFKKEADLKRLTIYCNSL
jgi:hypothetical protein